MFNGLNQSGNPYGIHFNKVEYLYNSRAALELSELARDKDLYEEVHDLLFTAFFHNGLNIGDHEVLFKIVEKAGINRNEAEDVLRDGTYRNRLVSALDEGRQLKVSAVPTFLFTNDQILTGAQPIDMFRYILAGGTDDSPLRIH